MRKKCLEYLKKPTQKLRNELTSMEQTWVDKQARADGDKEKPKAKNGK